MTSPVRPFDLCVLGSGPVAAAVALGAARLGARTALVDCGGPAPEAAMPGLAALVEAGRAAISGAAADWPAVRRTAAVVEGAEQLAAVAIYRSRGPGRFVTPREIEAEGERLQARRFVVVPPAAAPSAMSTVLAWETLPVRLSLQGGGAEAIALAQALARLGVAVSLRPGGALLPGFDPELAGFVRRRLAAEGVAVGGSEGPDLDVPEPRPALAGLGLAEAGIAWSEAAGIVTDAGGRTTNRRVWAVPFAACRSPIELAAAALRPALLRLPVRRSPRLAFALTDPQLVQVGLDEAAARDARLNFRLLRWPLAEGGLIKAVVDRRGRVLGAGIVASQAAELIAPWSLAVARRLPALALAEGPVPWPSAAEAGRSAAASTAIPLLLSGRLQRWARLMLRLG